MSYQVFVSYRRDGGETLACLISEKLKKCGIKAFYDVESMRSGKFNEEIFSVIDSCSDVIVILPPKGLDRCVNEDDWVRKEIAYAIEKQKNIIPVMMRNFEFPKELPDDIDDIRNYHGINANMEYFDASFDKLLSLLCAKPQKRKSLKLLPVTTIVLLSLCIALGIGFAVYKSNDNTPSDAMQDSNIYQIDTIAPKIILSEPSFNTDSIKSGSIEFTVSVEENTEFYSININDTTVETVGFTADMDVVDQGKTQILRFTNVEKTADECYITLLEGVAKDAANNKSEICNSQKFSYNTVFPIMTLAPKDSNKIVKEGDTAVYLVAVSDDEVIVGASVRKQDIQMYGFVADITINKKPDTDNVWEITFSDIKFNNDSDTKYFEIAEGIAVDWYGNISRSHKLPLKTK